MQAGLSYLFSTLLLLGLLGLLEAVWLQRKAGQIYPWRASLASLLLYGGSLLCGALALKLVFLLLDWLYQHRLTEPDLRDWRVALAFFLGMEGCYYAYHRISHQVRWFWASHAVHHSSRHLNMMCGLRLGWTSELSGTFLFYAPMVWLGFTPYTVFAVLGVILLYQFWLHTELIGSLGPLDWLFNTPSNHRVHHALEAEYAGRNFGGMLMLFDHVFGSYAKEQGRGHVYGLSAQLNSHHPLKIALHEWLALLRDLRQAQNWRQLGQALFGRPR